MAVESAADRLSFFSADEFGASGSYLPASVGTASDVAGIFNDPHLSLQLNNVEVSDSQPTFLCREADLPEGAAGGDVGDTLTISGTIYRVIDLQPDGSGMVVVTLGDGVPDPLAD